MQIFKISPTIVRPLSANYAYDSTLQLNSYVDEFEGGLQFSLINALSSARDSSHNNHTSFALTNENQINSTMTVLAPTGAKFPFKHSTYIQSKDSNNTWLTFGTGEISLSGNTSGTNSEQYFEIHFLNEFECVIRYFDSSTSLLSAAAWNQSLSSVEFISITADQGFTYSDTLCTYSWDRQKFMYYMSNTDTIAFLVPDQVDHKFTIYDDSGVLNFAEFDSNIIANSANQVQWAIRPLNQYSRSITLSSDYYRYAKNLEGSNFKVDASGSIANVLNNYLITVTESDILSSTLNLNLLPLKNQITIDGNQSEGNPYNDSETYVHHRKYNKLHTGNNQVAGNDTVYMNYFSGVKEVTLEPNKLTYFHLPREITPFTRLNVNDSLLYRNGSIAGNSPITSDKIFKKRVDDQDDTPIVDEKNGALLCSWLSGNHDPNSTPIWVDRYYNPNYSNLLEAMSSQALYVEYSAGFQNTVALLSAEGYTVFDKKSDLTFEPGCLYAYHHIGSTDIQNTLDSLVDSELFRNIKNYRDFRDNEKVQILSDTGILNTYTLKGSSYGVTDAINHTGSFTLAFTLEVDDWTKPFANQIIGNFTNKGFSVENTHQVTPLIVFPDGQKIQIYNTDFRKIKTYDLSNELDGNIMIFTRKDVIDDLYLCTTSNTIYQYNTNGIMQNRITDHLAVTAEYLHDIEVNEDFLFISVSASDTFNKRGYLKYALSAWDTEQSVGTNALHREAGIYTPQYIHSTSQNNIILTGGVIALTTDALSGNATTIDNTGNPWWIEGPLIKGYVDGSNITVVSAVSGGYIEQIQFDHRNNLWILHDQNTVSMLNSARQMVFSTILSATPSGSRYLDMVYEFGNTGYTQYGIIMNFALTAADSNVFKIKPDGALLDTVSVVLSTASPLSGWKTTTGWDYIRKQKLSAVPSIRAKMRLSKIFNQKLHHETYDDYEIVMYTDSLKKGSHSFVITFDAENGSYSMSTDGIVISSIDVNTAWYSTSKIFDQPLIVGSPSFFNGDNIQTILQQPLYYRQLDSSMKDILLYDRALDAYEVGMMHIKNGKARPVKFDVPTGQRSFIETIDRFFRHKLPVRRTSRYNINIVNSNITSSELRSALEVELSHELDRITPVAAELHQITWDTDIETLSAIELIPEIETKVPSNSGLSNTDSIDTGVYSQ